MKHFISVFLIIGSVLIFFGCQKDNPTSPELNQSDQTPIFLAKKPAPSLNCTTEYDFAGHLGIFDAEGRLLGWIGEIHGDIEGVIKWWMVVPMNTTGQASHFEARFEIWKDGELLLAGDEEGKTNVRHEKNTVWQANGIVTEASQKFEEWIGRQVHESGHFTWADSGLPDHGEGTFRVN